MNEKWNEFPNSYFLFQHSKWTLQCFLSNSTVVKIEIIFTPFSLKSFWWKSYNHGLKFFIQDNLLSLPSHFQLFLKKIFFSLFKL